MTGLSIDRTQALGIAAFALAALACLWNARRQHRPWLALAAVHGGLAAEIWLGWRYRLHDLAAALLLSEGAYEGRAPWQAALIAAALALFAWALLASARRGPRSPGVAGALAGTALTATVFLVETISLHAVDGVMYADAGPVRFIAWLWLAGALLTTASALRARRGSSSPGSRVKPPSPTGPRR